MEKMIPKGCDWLQTKVETFHPESNTVLTSDGDKVCCANMHIHLSNNTNY